MSDQKRDMLTEAIPAIESFETETVEDCLEKALREFNLEDDDTPQDPAKAVFRGVRALGLTLRAAVLQMRLKEGNDIFQLIEHESGIPRLPGYKRHVLAPNGVMIVLDHAHSLREVYLRTQDYVQAGWTVLIRMQRPSGEYVPVCDKHPIEARVDLLDKSEACTICGQIAARAR